MKCEKAKTVPLLLIGPKHKTLAQDGLTYLLLMRYCLYDVLFLQQHHAALLLEGKQSLGLKQTFFQSKSGISLVLCASTERPRVRSDSFAAIKGEHISMTEGRGIGSDGGLSGLGGG